MSDVAEVSGGCLCGAVRFTARMPSLFCAHCHCSMCRRNHGAAFVTWFAVPPEQLAIETGAAEIVRHASSEHGRRSFCGRCGTSLFCESDRYPDRVDVALGVMDGAIDRAPQLHAYFDSRAAWITLGDELPRLGGSTGLEPLSDDES